MFFATFLGVITQTVSHISFQLFVIERMISGTLCNLLEFPFDYVPRSLFIGKGLILGWISLVEMEPVSLAETTTDSHPQNMASLT